MQFPFRHRILTYLINARRNELAKRRDLIEILAENASLGKKKFGGGATD